MSGKRGRWLKRPRPGNALALLVGLGVAVLAFVVAQLITGSSNPSRPSASGPPALAPPAQTSLGISVNRLFNDQVYSQAQIDGQLAQLRATGATEARSDALWEAAEPTAPKHGVHHYAWAFDDKVAAALARHGLTWLAIVDYSAPWAQSVPGVDHSPPFSALPYAQYAAAFTARYGAGGEFWRIHPELPALPVQTLEIWNEPDGAFWLPHPDPRGYANLYAAARAAAKSVDPRIRVIIGGLTRPLEFVPALLRVRPDLAGRIDGVGIHPYGPNPLSILTKLRADRQMLDAMGLGGVPLYVTEFGWPTDPPGAQDYLPAAIRPGYIEQTIDLLAHSGCGVAAVLLYTWITPERVLDDREDWFGIHPSSGADSESARAFASGIAAAKDPRTPTRGCRSG